MTEPPPKSTATDLRVAHLTQAVSRKGEIRFELHVPENDNAADLAAALANRLMLNMAYVPASEGPISVDEDRDDRSKITIVYKPHGKRSMAKDMQALVVALDEAEIPLTDKVKAGVQQAFDALKDSNAPGHAAAEAARRSAKPRDRVPR